MTSKDSDSRRLFVALDIPREIGQLMPMIKSVVQTPLQEVRWLSGYHLHLTLSFLGNVNDRDIGQLVLDLKATALGAPIKLSVENTGIFPDTKHPRVLWLGIEQGHHELIDLQKTVDQMTLPYKASGKKEHFVPHITIGRVNHRVRSGGLDLGPFLNTVYAPLHFTVDHIKLYESNLTPQGARYTVIDRFNMIETA